MSVFFSVVVSLLLCIIARWVYNWRNPRCNGKLPPGSMGLPIIGETLQFFTPYKENNISPFIKKRTERYGSLFKTSLVGQPVIVSTNPELNRLVFQQEGKLFQLSYPKTFNEIFGRETMSLAEESIHKYLRNLTLNFFGFENLKENLLPDFEKVICKNLQYWCDQESVELKGAVTRIAFNFGAKKLFSYSESKSAKNLRQAYADFQFGLISFPLIFPGTAYWKCLQGCKKARNIIKNLLDERRAAPKRQKKDFLDLVLDEMNQTGSIMTEGMASTLLFGLTFAVFETTSISMTLAIKNVAEHPKVLEELSKEHEAIIRNRENTESGVTWQEYRSMTFTHMVINETIRLANIVPGIFRRVLQDVEIKGYTIPKGWNVMVCPPAIHLNPEQYSDPLTFNPWRWQEQEFTTASKNYMGFGGGSKLCAGADFAKLELAIFLHHLVTKYRCRVIKGGDIVRLPAITFPKGFHIQIKEKII